jgi:HD-GYP domain-containing protein (c-di-GMP phosphodiesterase class II)
MTTDRPYRKKLGLKDVIKELMRCSGSQFDPLVVDAAVQLLEKRVEAEEQETARQIENIQVVQTST